MSSSDTPSSRIWTPRLAPRTAAVGPAATTPAADTPAIDFTPPARVRPAPDAPGITVAHLSAASKPYVYVGPTLRGLPTSPLGDPFQSSQGVDAVTRFRDWLRDAYKAEAAGRASLEQHAAIAELRRLVRIYREDGTLTLACCCAIDEPCHATVIAQAIIGIVEREVIELPGLGWATWYRPTAEEGLPWVVLGEDGRVLRMAASLTHARQPLARRFDRSEGED